MTDAAHFTEIYRLYSVLIYRFALHMSGSVAIAEEAVQDCFLEFMCHPNAFDQERGTLAAYLYGIARNLVRRHLERNRRFAPVDDEEADIFVCESELLEHLTRGEDLHALQEAILRLPEKYREVIVLCDLQEMTYEAAAVVLECAVGTIRSRLHRGRGLLIARMQSRCAI